MISVLEPLGFLHASIIMWFCNLCRGVSVSVSVCVCVCVCVCDVQLFSNVLL